MRQLTKDEAIAFAESGAWEKMTARELAAFQMEQDKLCVPFDKFHAAVSEALGRPVWTHEFGLNRDGLRAELEGKATAPTFEQIVAMLPADRTILVAPPTSRRA